MNAASVLTEKNVVLGLRAATKDDVIGELLDVLVASGLIKDRAAALKAVLDREKKMSTGLQFGVAIPHCKTDTIENVSAVVGVKKDGVPFESLDGLPAQIIVLTISPLNKPGPHIQFLAEISKSLSSAAVRGQILDAASGDAVVAALCPEKAALPAA
jgi:PTS system nitrogen regulatory IIA component